MAFLKLLKAGHYLPPLAALILVTGWQVWQRQETAALTREVAKGREKIAALKQQQLAAEGDSAVTGISPATILERIQAIDTAKINWKQVAMAFTSKPDPHGITEAEGTRIRIRCFLWSSDQLNTALDQIARTTDLTDQERRSLEGQLLAGLCSRYPAAALTRFELDPEASLKTCYNYAQAVSNLAKKDPAAAAAWVDRIVSDGPDKEKQGYGPGLLKANLIEGLLLGDKAEATRRLAACPEKERADLLGKMHPSSEQVPAYIALLRENLPADQVPKSLVNAIYPLLWSGSETVSKMLDGMSASPEERLAVVDKMTEYPFGSVLYNREVREDEVTSLHDWFARQAPGKENELMGQSLGKLLAAGNEDFSRIAAMVTKYDADGSSGMLIPFLSGLPPSLSADVAPLVERIADPARREEIRSRFQK